MAKTNLKHYVEFFYPGAFMSESSTQEVTSRDALQVDAPKDCFGYRFFDRQEIVAEDGEVLMGSPKNHSGIHYFGEVKTLEDIKNERPDPTGCLERNMESNGWNKVVKTRRGNYQPFREQDILVSKK